MSQKNNTAHRYYHFAELIQHQAKKYENRTAIRYRDDQTGNWHKISWNAFYEKTRLAAQAMIEFGIHPHDRIGVYAQNMPNCFFADFGAYSVRATPVPMYATSSPAQIEYIVRDADIKMLFVGEQLQYNNAFRLHQETGLLTSLIIFDPNVVRNPADNTSLYFDEFIRRGDHNHAESEMRVRCSQASPSDIAAIIYTSGTTGQSKGVILTHSNFIEVLRIHEIRIPSVDDRDVSMCFLPLSHIFEKAWTCFCFHRGIQVAVNRDPKQIQQTLKEIKPTLMCNVPRFWEKVYIGAKEKINSSAPLLQKIFKKAIAVGYRYQVHYKCKQVPPPRSLAILFHLYDNTIFKMLRKALGLEKGRFFPVAGAPLPDHVAEFFISVNIPIKYGYGLSETTATVCFYPETNYHIGSIGKIMPDVSVRIAPENNEILVKGKTVMSGYYNKPEDTLQSFTDDGYFRTGDAGRLEGDTLYFLERIKDLFKTSNGKYIAPQAIELSLVGSKYIDQCATIGDQRKFVSALIVPDLVALEKYAQKKGIEYKNHAELIKNEEVIRLFQTVLEECQKGFASYEKIKRFTLLIQPFSIESGELTDTLKLKRPTITKHYAAEIEAMYQE